MSDLILEELIDGWRLIAKNAVVAKFGKANLQQTLAINSLSVVRQGLMIDESEILVKVYTESGEAFAKKHGFEYKKFDSWKISEDFFNFENSKLRKDINKTISLWSDTQEVLLRAGEMSRDELRTAMAVLGGLSRSLESILQNIISDPPQKIASQGDVISITGFTMEQTGGGCTSLNYYPQSAHESSLYVMVTDELQVPTESSEKIEVGLYTPESECLFYKEYANKEEATSVALNLARIADSMAFEPSEDPAMYDDMLTDKEDGDFSIQIHPSSKQYSFIVTQQIDSDELRMGKEHHEIQDAFQELVQFKTEKSAKSIITP